MTVRDYLEANPNETPRRASLLLSVEAIIHQMGYDWDTLPYDQWVNVFKQLNNLSPQTVSQYDGVIRAYYKWLDECGVMRMSSSPYRKLNAESISEVFAYQNSLKYVSTVNDLIYYTDHLQAAKRITDKARFLNKACLVLLWAGLDIQDMTELLESDLKFFDDDDSVLNPPQNADSIVRIMLILRSSHSARSSCTIANRQIIRILFDLWSEAHSYKIANALDQAPLLIAEGAGKRSGEKISLSVSSLTMRINRVIKSINTTYNLSLDCRSIRLSAMYHAAYSHWKLYNLSWEFSERNIQTLFGFLRREVSCPLCIQKVEYQKFIEYVRSVKKDPMIG